MTAKLAALQRLHDKVEAGKVLQWFNWNSGIGSNGPLARQAYNGSLDAAKALHEALLPGWIYLIGGHVAGVSMPDHEDPRWWNTMHDDTPARAWLLAIIKALMAQEGE